MVKIPPANAGDVRDSVSIPGSGRSPGEGNGNPLRYWRVCELSHVHLFASPWTVSRQAPLSLGFSRQEYWCGLPFPPPGYTLHRGIESGHLCSRQILYCLRYKGNHCFDFILLPIHEGKKVNKQNLVHFKFVSPIKFTIFNSSILAWRIPGTEEPGRLQSMGSCRVGHD